MSESPPPILHIDGTSVPIDWRRNGRSRRYILRLKRPACLVATIPRGGSKSEAWDFIQRSQPWIRQQLSQPIKVPPIWQHGTEVWFRGEKYALQATPASVQFASEMIAPQGDLKAAVHRRLQEIASAELIPRTRELAARCGLEILRVTIRNQRSRWGSCSTRRAISLNWRLVQTPQFVVDYIILHELMHLRQMNHSRRFWDEVEKVCPTWRDAEKWLRQFGREILPG